MASLNTMGHLEVAHIEIREVIETIRTKIENMSNVDDFSVDAKGERDLIEQTMGDIVKASASHLIALKTRLNALVPINRLPVEILTYIILLTSTGTKKSSRRYIRYSSVCHRWRSAVIQNSAFWTVIQHRYCYREAQSGEPIYEEFLRRAKSTKLDVRLSQYSVPFISTLKKLFAEESDRICSLHVDENSSEELLQLVLSGKQFPSLQRLAIIESYSGYRGSFFNGVAPVLYASDHLETLHCSLGNGDLSFDQLAPMFTRIRNLNLYIRQLVHVPPLLEILHNSAKLQTLQLYLKENFENHVKAELPHQVVLPELQFLCTGSNCFPILALFRTPNLTSLNAICQWRANPVALAFEEFNSQSIRHLHICCSRNRRKQCGQKLCVLGAKEPIGCNSLFSTRSDIFFEDPLTQKYARDCFHFGFDHDQFAVALQGMTGILSQLTSLVELYFLIPHSQVEFETLISHLPSVEKVVVQRGNNLLDVICFLSNTPSPCPQLKCLYFKTFAVPRGLVKYANDVGRSLTKWLQARRKESLDLLERIILGNCPPLPDTWLKKVQDLGTDVVTEKDVENIQVISKSRKRVNYESNNKFSDIEI